MQKLVHRFAARVAARHGAVLLVFSCCLFPAARVGASHRQTIHADCVRARVRVLADKRESICKRQQTSELWKGLPEGKGKAKANATRVLLSLLTSAAHFLPACIRFAVSCPPWGWLFPLLPLASNPFCFTVPGITFFARLPLLVSPSLAQGCHPHVYPLQFYGLASPLPFFRG